MSSKIRNVLAVGIVTAALGFSVGAAAGVIDKAAAKLRDHKAEQKSDQPSGKRPTKSAEPRTSGGRPSSSPPPRDTGRESHPDDRGRDRSDQPQGSHDNGPSHDLNDDLARLHGNDRDRDRGNDHDRGDNRGGGENHDRDHNHDRPPRVVERLPYGYRDYYWNGNSYYSYGGHWYRPYGGTYISISVPFGLFVTSLPGYYSSFWLGGTRYFYSDETYYVYEAERRGYVVAHSPYGDDDYNDSALGDDLYVYPAQGQSEQQQADDRYQCHRWAVDQSNYDPLDDEYDASRRADYRRAMTACLTGRGYTVN